MSFEAPLPSVVVALLRRWPGTFLDVGANTGFYSLAAVTAHRRVVAIACEPVPEIVRLLEANLSANARGRSVTVREVAVGDRTGTVALHLPPAQPDGTIETSASIDGAFKSDVERILEVEAITLDDLWRAAGAPAVPLVKVDVEGAEPMVVAGCAELVAACRPVFTLEVLDGADVAVLERFRRQHDYVDVTLSEVEAVVGRPEVAVDRLAPNHLIVPSERLADTIVELQRIPRLIVTVLA